MLAPASLLVSRRLFTASQRLLKSDIKKLSGCSSLRGSGVLAYQHVPYNYLDNGTRGLSTKASRMSPYQVLGVDRAATDKEIKLAYFREAKKWHPDVNPGDHSAKEKFQEVAAAYELLRDAKKRADYDRYEASGGSNYQSNKTTQDWHQSASYAQTNAHDIFTQVQQDAEVVKDALKMYAEEVQDDLKYAGKLFR
jgi:DnaJ-class molecular chaperone